MGAMNEEGALLSRDAIRALLSAAMDTASADDVRVVLSGTDGGYTRYAANEVTTAAEVRDSTASITCAFGQKHATVTTHDLGPEGLARAVARAEAMARIVPADPEFVSDVGAQTVVEVPAAWAPGSSSTHPAARADVIAGAIADARGRNLQAAGFFSEEARALCVATRRGFFGYHRETQAQFTTTVRTMDGSGSGWAGVTSARRGDVDAPALCRRAADLAERSKGASPLAPGTYAAVLSAEALAGLLPFLLQAMDQRAADEGRSFFTRAHGGDRLGQHLFGDVVLRTDPAEALVPGAPFDEYGVLRPAQVLIDRGICKQLFTSRYWAQKTRRKATAQPGSLVLSVSKGVGTAESLVTGMKRGLLLTRVWYVEMLDPQTLTVTGLSRDGTFLVEEGKVTRPVNNFRFNQGLPELLAAIEQATAPMRTSETGLACPAVRVRAFHCTSQSEAV